MESACTGKPGFVIEPDDVDNESIAFPVSNGIAHVAWKQIAGMVGIQRDRTKYIHVFIKDDNLFRSLNDLLRKQSKHHRSRHAGGQATRGRVIDTSIIEGFHYLLCGPFLIRSALASSCSVIR